VIALLVSPPAIPKRSGGRALSFLAWQKRHLVPDQYRSLPMENLGIMSIKAYAKSRGLDVRTVSGLVGGHTALEETWAAMITAARGATPALIGFSSLTKHQESDWLAARARTRWPDARIVVGNTFASLNPDRVLRERPCFDFVVVGEGEVPFVRLAEALFEGRPTDDVPGLVWRDADGSVRRNPPSAIDLDRLPWPCRDELPAVLAEGYAAAVFTNRGCPYRCTFCGTGATSQALGRAGYRHKSVENVVDEIEHLHSDYGIRFVTLTDDLFMTKQPSSQNRAAQFAEALIRRRLDLEFMVDLRVDSVSDPQLIRLLHRAGLRRAFVGIESGSYEQLARYRKRQASAGIVERTIRVLQDCGVDVIPGLIMFHADVGPGELRESLRALESTGYHAPRMLLNRMVAYAGTPLHRDYEQRDRLMSDWPEGEWSFADARAELVYRRLSDRLDADENMTFAEAATVLRLELDAWEEAVQAEAGRAHQPVA
jgi:radical SAM superfamily enzyme YgiQ (UPF0313 family)